jgi:hypothetical protein
MKRWTMVEKMVTCCNETPSATTSEIQRTGAYLWTTAYTARSVSRPLRHALDTFTPTSQHCRQVNVSFCRYTTSLRALASRCVVALVSSGFSKAAYATPASFATRATNRIQDGAVQPGFVRLVPLCNTAFFCEFMQHELVVLP